MCDAGYGPVGYVPSLSLGMSKAGDFCASCSLLVLLNWMPSVTLEGQIKLRRLKRPFLLFLRVTSIQENPAGDGKH